MGNHGKLMSAGERKQRIIASIIEDFSLRPRLNNNRGTAILVAASIYDACHYFRLFQATNFGEYCGVITSFQPNHNAISRESAKSDERYKFDTYTQHVLAEDQTTQHYETDVKRRFIKEPANMKLLIVVSKLLTGFDAPSCSVIYLDNELRDHNLFQAICRTNRLDGDDKDYGYIVDFKELFGDVQQAIAVYSSDELDLEGGGDAENNVHLKDWLEEGKEKLEASREALNYLCESVPLPRDVEQYIYYFCGHITNPEALVETEVLRVSFYKAVASFVRTFAAIAQHLDNAGYDANAIIKLNNEVAFFSDTRAAIKRHAGEELDIKPYEADMRHLINTYIQAEPAAPLGKVDKYSLVELIIETSIHDAIAKKLNDKGKLSNNAVAEGIINNVRKTIIREHLTDPRFYDEMSALLDDLIQQQRDDTDSYEAFLKEMETLVKKMSEKDKESTNTPYQLQGKPEAIVLFGNLKDILADSIKETHQVQDDVAEIQQRATLALALDKAMRKKSPAGWLGDEARERQVLNVLFPLMNRNKKATRAIFEIIKNQRNYQ